MVEKTYDGAEPSSSNVISKKGKFVHNMIWPELWISESVQFGLICRIETELISLRSVINFLLDVGINLWNWKCCFIYQIIASLWCFKQIIWDEFLGPSLILLFFYSLFKSLMQIEYPFPSQEAGLPFSSLTNFLIWLYF